MVPPFLPSPALLHPSLAHGFFSRIGGVSTGLHASLNCSLGSQDEQENVSENRDRIRRALGADQLQTCYQIHSADVITVTAPLVERPRADGLVTRVPGIALGVLAADCNPVLLADAEAGVIGACHAGWRGAVAGVALNTIQAMRNLGARNITAVLGPAIQQESYEVGMDLRDIFTAAAAGNIRFFAPNAAGQYQFDLPGYLQAQLIAAGVSMDRLQEDTYSQPDKYFSYRRRTHLAEPDNGTQMSAIMLKA